MNILVIAYEFPPICSAQSLRWHYLAGELVRMGHSVTVVTTDFKMRRHLAPPTDARIDVIRTFPGLFVGAANRLERHLARGGVAEPPSSAASGQSAGGLSRGYRFVRRLLDQVVFPDVRSEWYFFARRILRRLVRSGYRPDLVIGSHEPAVDLQLAIAAQRYFDAPFVADLGDPVDTVYSPRWRRRLDRRYEGYVLGRADGVLVTLESVRAELQQRHPKRHGRIEVVPQGFDHRRPVGAGSVVPFRRDRLNILFTGTLYESFRNPEAFLEAVGRRSDVQLWIAGNLVGSFPGLAGRDNIRLVGPLSHGQALDAQAGADVLLSVGNRQAEQIPGKIYEYFGAKRPILHLYSAKLDPTRGLVDRYSRGWSAAMTQASCTKIIDELVQRRREGTLERGLDLTSAHAGFSWHARAERLIQFAVSRQNLNC